MLFSYLSGQAQDLCGELIVRRRRYNLVYDLSGTKVKDNHQIDPAAAGPYINHTTSDLVWAIRCELTSQKVWHFSVSLIDFLAAVLRLLKTQPTAIPACIFWQRSKTKADSLSWM
jgi:hypothetical protein